MAYGYYEGIYNSKNYNDLNNKVIKKYAACGGGKHNS